jgi:hypothetical protein
MRYLRFLPKTPENVALAEVKADDGPTLFD